MNTFEQTIVQLAETYERPDEFIHILERSFMVPSDEKGTFFYKVGIIFCNLSRFVLALNLWNHALKYFIKNNDKLGKSSCYGNLGVVYVSLGNYKKAIKALEKSLEIDKEIGDKIGESTCYLNLGAAYFGLGDVKKAIAYYEKSLENERKNRRMKEESDCYTNLGNAYNKLGNFKKAIEYYEKALEIAEKVGYKAGESKSYVNSGNAYLNLGNFRKAINLIEKSLEINKDIGDKVGESKCYDNIGNIYLNLGDFRKAHKYHQKSLEINKDIGNRAGESDCYGNLGKAYDRIGNYRKALEYHEKSLEIKKEIGDRSGESACYTEFGNSHHSLGDLKKALKYHEKSLEIKKDIGDRSGESVCYINLGNTHHSLGDYRKTQEYYEKSLEIKKDIGDRSGESSCYGNLGVVFLSLGNYKKAIKALEKSLEIDKDIGDRSGESVCYRNLGNTYYRLGDYRKTLEYHEKSLEIYKDIGNKAGESSCYANFGDVYFNLGDFRRAIEYYEKSLKINKEIGDRSLESKCYGNLGGIYYRLKEFRKAIKFYKNSLKIAKKLGYINLERTIELNLGRIYYESKPKLAYAFYKHSIELLEVIRGKLVEEEHTIGFFESSNSSEAYQCMVPLCLKLNKEKEAFEYTERSKSRAFLDLHATAHIRPSVKLKNKMKYLLDDEEIYLAKLREIQTRHLKQTKLHVELGEIERIRENLNYIYDKIEKFDSEYAFIRRGKPLSLKKIKDVLTSQKRDVVLVEYFITKEEIFIFVVPSKDKVLHIERVPISREKLNQYIFEDYWKEVVKYPEFEKVGDNWRGLSDYLIEPISKYLSQGDLIYFVPHGPLHYLPIHALELKYEPLIKKYPVVYSPNASLTSFCKNKGSGKLQSCASFGVVFEEEAEKVAKIFNSKAYNGYLATKDKIHEKCINKDVIHFSCHGHFDDLDPLSSGIVLSDNVLTVREIFDMRLDAELVTLSACQTGLNKISPGDELIGLTRSFLYAGAASIIVSLWSIDARSAKEFMIKFYTLLKNGLNKATALQAAQKELMEKKKYSHPYHWAPFVLVGDWE